MSRITPEQIDECLPQIQCGLCGHGGCMPYAEAICFDNAPIHLCPPGGVKTLLAIANLMSKDPSPYLQQLKSHPETNLPIIREQECIGCTRCIQVCPVDAILGSPKEMHTVIADECTSCGLCVKACPVDCIDLIQIENTMVDSPIRKQLARERFNDRNKRLAEVEKLMQSKKSLDALKEKQKYIEEAIARASAKKAY
jgi:electron transport complex protein RnfB